MTIRQATDEFVGSAAAAVGGTGAAIQASTDITNVVVLVLNLVLALLGIWLVIRRHRLLSYERRNAEMHRDHLRSKHPPEE